MLKAANIKFENIKRVKDTKYMYKIKSYNQREQNIKNAFYIQKNYIQKNILIVDYIVTKGSTNKELKKERIENHGDKKVIFFTVAVVREYFK